MMCIWRIKENATHFRKLRDFKNKSLTKLSSSNGMAERHGRI